MATEHDSRYHLATLADLNHALSDLCLEPITRNRMDQILASEPRTRLIQALNNAHSDKRALSYLQRFFVPVTALSGQSGLEEPHIALDPTEYSSTNETGPAPGHDVSASTRRQEEQQVRLNKHVYGSKGALCFEPDETRGGVHTICMDAADANGPKQYNWQNKLRVQLTRDELLQVTAVLFGFLPRCDGKNHGEDNSKGFTLEDQGDKLFLRVFAKGHGVKAVPIFPEDAFYVAGLFLGQLMKNMPWLSSNEILATLQRVHSSRRSKSPTTASGPLTRH